MITLKSNFFKNNIHWFGLIVILGIFLGHLISTTTFICDDAFITFRYSENLANFGSPVYNIGQRVEGISNFLWMILLSIFSKTGFYLPTTAIFLGIFFAVITLIFHYKITLILDNTKKNRFLSWGSPLLLVSWAPFVIWSTGGLETSLFTSLLMISLFLTLKNKFLPFFWGLSWFLLTITRPEGIAFFGITFIWLLISTIFQFVTKSKSKKIFFPLIKGSLFFLILFTAFSLFRLYYYSELLPNTWYTKVYGIPPSFLWRHGKNYLFSFISLYHLKWISIIILGILFHPKVIIKKLSLIFSLTLFWFIWVMKAGGDFMAAHRFMAIILPLFSILIYYGGYGIGIKLNKLFKTKFTLPISLSIFIIFISGILFVESIIFEKNSLRSEKTQFGMESIKGMKNFVNDRILVGRAIAKLLGKDKARNISMAVGGAGAISFESGVGIAIDTFGLSDKKIARQKIKPGRFYKPGHLKQASWRYLKFLNPDILCSPGIAYIGSGHFGKQHRKRVLAYWKNYVYFCLNLPLSSNDKGVKRKKYCCIKKRDLFPQLLDETYIGPL